MVKPFKGIVMKERIERLAVVRKGESDVLVFLLNNKLSYIETIYENIFNIADEEIMDHVVRTLNDDSDSSSIIEKITGLAVNEILFTAIDGVRFLEYFDNKSFVKVSLDVVDGVDVIEKNDGSKKVIVRLDSNDAHGAKCSNNSNYTLDIADLNNAIYYYDHESFVLINNIQGEVITYQRSKKVNDDETENSSVFKTLLGILTDIGKLTTSYSPNSKMYEEKMKSLVQDSKRRLKTSFKGEFLNELSVREAELLMLDECKYILPCNNDHAFTKYYMIPTWLFNILPDDYLLSTITNDKIYKKDVCLEARGGHLNFVIRLKH